MLEQVLDRTIWQRRLTGVVFLLLASLALLLATIGIYSVVAYSVSQRIREIGIRSALGAQRGHILRMVFVEAARFVTPGIAIGIALGLAVGRAAAALLFEISPYDPLTFASVVGLLATLSACACVVPASRAARLDPICTLRTD
jgi:putative ABC transport system permease protein